MLIITKESVDSKLTFPLDIPLRNQDYILLATPNNVGSPPKLILSTQIRLTNLDIGILITGVQIMNLITLSDFRQK